MPAIPTVVPGDWVRVIKNRVHFIDYSVHEPSQELAIEYLLNPAAVDLITW